MLPSRIIKVVIAATLLSSCSAKVEYEDISQVPAYRSLVGRELSSPSDLVLHAITLDRNYAKRIDQCSITQPPGFGGPEVVVRSVLPAGTIFHVRGIRRCKNCLFDKRIELLVSSESATACGTAPIEIPFDTLGELVLLKP